MEDDVAPRRICAAVLEEVLSKVKLDHKSRVHLIRCEPVHLYGYEL